MLMRELECPFKMLRTDGLLALFLEGFCERCEEVLGTLSSTEHLLQVSLALANWLELFFSEKSLTGY